MESKKINQLATELAPDLSDLTIIGDPTTGISKKITLSQMASLFTGTVEEYANLAAFPITGVADTIYVAKDTNVIYRWDSTSYVVLSPNIIASLVFNDANGFDGTISLVGSVATLTITTALTSGSVPFIGASGALTQDNSNLFFDDTNNRLGIATASPTTPLDVFGSGIIGRLNATSTNNSYLGFSSNGTNKWSAGNVQSDHRFRIFSEANSAELITILQTGEFGIGIANPTTKFHIDGAASALIANLDANVSIAKSLSFRSDNSARINLEVSGTESGSNVGADFFLRTFTDAGSLIETPFTIVRSTGVTTIKSLTLTNVLSVANGGTGSATQNFVDLTTTQSIGGAKTLTSALAGTSASFSSTATATAFIPSGATVPTNGMYLSAANTLNFSTNTTNRLSISSIGEATFTSSVTLPNNNYLQFNNSTGSAKTILTVDSSNTTVLRHAASGGFFALQNFANTANNLLIADTGAATFSSSVQSVSFVATGALNSGLIAANTSFIDNSSATARFLSYGANSLTRGAFSFIQASSTNTLQQVSFVIDTSGNAGFGSSTIYNGGGFQKVISFYSPSSLALTYASDTQQYQVGIASNDYRVYDFTGSTYRFVVKGTTGNVVIGDTTDTGYKLQVNGTTSTGSVFLNAPNDGFANNLIGAARFGNVSSATIDLTTVFPSNSFTTKGISVMLQIVSASSSSNTLSCIWNLVRTGAGTWTSSAINQITNGITITSITGSGTTITINFSGGAQYGTVNISVSTYA